MVFRNRRMFLNVPWCMHSRRGRAQPERSQRLSPKQDLKGDEAAAAAAATGVCEWQGTVGGSAYVNDEKHTRKTLRICETEVP